MYQHFLTANTIEQLHTDKRSVIILKSITSNGIIRIEYKQHAEANELDTRTQKVLTSNRQYDKPAVVTNFLNKTSSNKVPLLKYGGYK